jgi:hypothetical protein
VSLVIKQHQRLTLMNDILHKFVLNQQIMSRWKISNENDPLLIFEYKFLQNIVHEGDPLVLINRQRLQYLVTVYAFGQGIPRMLYGTSISMLYVLDVIT